MSSTTRQGPVAKSPAAKPVAVLIAAKMRITIPKAAQSHGHAPVNVKQALKTAANSSPAAKAAFKRAAPAVKAAAPHLKALAQPNRGLLSSLRHGVSAMHSLRKVTREMARETPSTLQSAKSAFKAAATSSPAAAAAFKNAGPAAAKAQTHVAALAKLQQSSNPSLLSSLGHGFQAMRALRQVTKEMQKESAPASLSPMHMSGSLHASVNPGHDVHEGPRPGLLSTFGQSVQMLRALHGTARTIAQHAIPEHSSTNPSGTQAGGIQSSGIQGPDSTPFALMLIARRKNGGLSPFKDRT